LPTAGQESKQVNVDNQSKKTQRKADRENIVEAIRILFEPGQVVELRVPKAGKLGTISGYFDDYNKLAKELENLSGTAPAVYYTLNPVNPALLARANNHTNPYAKGTTSDAADNIIKRRWLLIDCDPVRPSEISSTEQEKIAAKQIAAGVRKYLRALGWPDPLVADSGNGYHLLYRIDLPNDDESRALIEAVLKALAARFDNSAVKIDQKVFNSSRITKAYGTKACKGDSIAERPHRLSGMFTPPDVIEPVAKELLVALAAEAPKPEKKNSGVATTASRGGWTPALVEEVLDKADVNRGDAMDYKGETKWQHDCLSNPDHRKPDAYTILDEDGYAHHHCSHNSCSDLEDADWRELWEERTGGSYPFPSRRKRQKPEILSLDDETLTDSELGPGANSWSQIADELDEVRRGKRTFENGDGKEEEEPLPRHIAEEHILQFVKDVFEKRGNGLFFFDAYPYVYLPEEKQVVRFQDDAEAHQLLAKVRLRIKQRDTELVRENLRAHIMEFGEQTRVEKLGCLRGGTIYVNNGRGGMFKITTDSILEVANGTDGVLMHAPDLKPFPPLDEAKLEEISKKLNGVGGKVTDSLLCQYLNAHFEESGSLTQSQYQQLVIMRFLTLFIGNSLDLRPIMIALGEQNSGKSTLWEKPMWLLYGTEYESAALPSKRRDFVAAMTNNAINIFDNIDSVNFDNPRSDYPEYIDLMCKASTGGKIPIAELYKTNVQRTYNLRCDQFLTARVNPFPSHRSDLSRRTLFFPIRMPSPLEYRTTEEIKLALAHDADEMKLEILVRLQNALRALVANKKSYPPVSQMHSFETFTMRVADHEGWADEMCGIWQGYMGDYRERITEDSPLVEYVRRWIGMATKSNAGRWARAGEIYADLQKVYGQDFTKMWRSSAVFGKRLKENKTALRVLGVEVKPLHGNLLYKFEPLPEQMERCRDAWNDSAPSRYLGDDALGVPDSKDVLD
jgi:hypothetical protein